MSRSIYRTSNDRHINELLSPPSTTSQSSTMSTSIRRANPRFKRNLRDQRRSTGIRPNDVSLASTSTEVISSMEFLSRLSNNELLGFDKRR